MPDPDPTPPVPMYLLQARKAMANNLPPLAQAAATIALAEGVWRLTELLADRNRILTPMVAAVEDPVRWSGGRYFTNSSGKITCGMVKDQTGDWICGLAAGHMLTGDQHEWVQV